MSESKAGVLTSLRAGAAKALAARIASAGLLFAMHVMLARRLGQSGYGLFSYTMSIVGLTAMLATLGWPMAMVRLLPGYIELRCFELARGALQRATQVVLVSSVLTATCAVMLGIHLPKQQGRAFLYASALIPIVMLASLGRRVLLSLEHILASSLPDDVLRPMLMLAAISIAPACWLSGAGAFTIYGVVMALTLLIGLVLLHRALPWQVLQRRPSFHTREWFLIALPLLMASASQVVISRTDVIMLGSMSTLQEVGAYTAANRLASLNVLVLGAVNAMAAPMIAAAYHSGAHGRYRLVVRQATILSVLGAIPCAAVLLLAPSFSLSIYGGGFAQHTVLLQVLAVGQFANAATGPVGLALSITGHERLFAIITAVAATSNVVLNYLLIPSFSGLGAAIASAVSIACMNVVFLVFVTLYARADVAKRQSLGSDDARFSSKLGDRTRNHDDDRCGDGQ